MKLKYYLRGLGIGILVSTIILTISFAGKKNDLSDAEVIARAKELGMVMEYDKKSDTIPKGTEQTNIPEETETQTKAEPDTQEVQKPENTEIQTEKTDESQTEKTEEPQTEVQTEQASGPETEAQTEKAGEQQAEVQEQNTPEPERPKDAEEAAAPQVKEFVVDRGASSDKVAEKLFKEGLVDDAAAFNRYLVENHCDSSIQNGTFQITEGASYEEISKILTSGR